MYARIASALGRVKRCAVPLLAAFLSGCGVSANLLPAENAASTSFASYDAVEAAYAKVNVGETNTPALTQLGFDTNTEPNVDTLSYYSVMYRFMPERGVSFESLPPAIQHCIDARERCVALVFHPARVHDQRVGGVVTDFLGFERTSVDTGWSADVLFVMLDGTVVYKTLQGKPRMQETRDLVQPLGPATNLGDALVRAGKSFGGKF